MSFTDDYLKLRKKRFEENQKKIADEVGGNDFSEEYAPLRATRVVTEEEEEDFAPVAPTPTNQSNERTWFQKGALDDGEGLVGVAKTILGSVADLGENIGAGIIGMGEKALDALMTIAPYVAQGQYYANGGGYNIQADQAFNQTIEAAKEGNAKFVEKDLYDEKAVAKVITGGTLLEKHTSIDVQADSVLGDKTDSLAQSAGQLAGTAALQAVGVPWWLTTGATAFGSESENALNQGATLEEAALSATISAGAEILTEKISGGISFGGKTWDAGMDALLARSISDKTVRTLLKFGIDAAGEGGEEILSGVLSAIGQKLTYEDDEKLFGKDGLFSSEEAFESFIGGAVLGGGSSVVSAVQSAKKGVDAVSGLTDTEEKVVRKVYEDAVAEAEADGKKLTQKEKSDLYDKTLTRLEKGYIDTETIESVLDEDYDSLKNLKDKESGLNEKIATLTEEIDTILDKEQPTIRDNERLPEARKELERAQSDLEKIGGYIGEHTTYARNNIQEAIKDTKLTESYNEVARRSQKFAADLSKYDAKQRAVVQKAIESGILNNTNKSHDFVDLVAKVSADKDIAFDFANNAKLKESGFAMEGKTVNGFVTKDGVTVNIDSQKALNSVVGHEITHILEGTELYTELQNIVMGYARSKGDYQGRYDTLKELYKGVKDADIDAELTADLVGDYLFTDTDFVNNLSVEHRDIFDKIFDEIKYLLKVATAGSKEARHLERVKKAFEDAYRQSGEAIGDTKYSMSDSDGDADIYSRVFDLQQKVGELSREIREYEDSAEFKTEHAKLNELFGKGDIDNAIKQYQHWLETSKYGKLKKQRDDLNATLENLIKERDNIIANEAKAAETAAIAKSGLSEADYFRKQAVKEFGHTPYFYDAGYITPNGKMLNFSGEKGKHFGGRGQDHRAIGIIYADTEGTDALNRFVKDGNIRIMAESPGIDISTVAEPTKEQYATIRRFVYDYAEKGFFNVDFTDESGRVVGSLQYENRINPTRILNDIKHYYETGEIREQSGVDRFRYSISDSDGKQLSKGQSVANENPTGDKDIRYSLSEGGTSADTFYSQMARVVDDVKQEKLGASSVVNMLRGKGVKAEEIKWSGIEEWLEGKKSVTKAELQEFVAGSMLQIEETIIDGKETPMSKEQVDKIADLERERNDLVKQVKYEWRRIIGTDELDNYAGESIPYNFTTRLVTAIVAKKGETPIGKEYKAAQEVVKEVCKENDDFGFDTTREAYTNMLRDPDSFLGAYELTGADEAAIRRLARAKEAWLGLEVVPEADVQQLKDLAEDVNRIDGKISRINIDHRTEQKLPRWGSYKIKGGENYREIVFKMPNSDYTNDAMTTHWREFDFKGVLAHARIQDFATTDGKKMLFIEEIQSDWHNEGHKEGYVDKSQEVTTKNTTVKHEDGVYRLYRGGRELYAHISDTVLKNRFPNGITEEQIHQGLVDKHNGDLKKSGATPDAPFRDTYHEYVLKRLIRMAADGGYDSIGWTPSYIQSERWSEDYEEGYRIEYDQNIPSFLKKYGKKWGATVGKAAITQAEHTVNGEHYDAENIEVWSLPITPAMKQSVLHEGQPMYSLSKEGEAPVRNANGIYGEDIRLSPTENVFSTVPTEVETAKPIGNDADDIAPVGNTIEDAIKDIYKNNGWGDISQSTDTDIDGIADGILTQWDINGSIKGNALHMLLDENAVYEDDVVTNEKQLHDIIEEKLREVVPALKAEERQTASNLPNFAENQIASYKAAIAEERANKKDSKKPSFSALKRLVVTKAKGNPAHHGVLVSDGKQYVSFNGAIVGEFSTPDKSIIENDSLMVDGLKNALSMANNNIIDSGYVIDPIDLSLIRKQLPKGDNTAVVVVGDNLYDIRYVEAVAKAIENPVVSLSSYRDGHNFLLFKGSNGQAVILPISSVNGGRNLRYVYKAEKISTEQTIPEGFAPTSEEEANAMQSENIETLTDAEAPIAESPIKDAPVKEAYEAIRPQEQGAEPSMTEAQPRMRRADSKKKAPVGMEERSWYETSSESEAVDGMVTPDDIPDEVRFYKVKSNKSTLDAANARLARDGYAKSREYFEGRMSERKLSVEDIALGERLIQEAAKAGDAEAVRDLIIDVSILGTELGQRVQALSIIQRLTPEGQLKALIRTVERGKAKGDKAFQGVEVTEDMTKRILDTKKPDGTFDKAELDQAVEDVKRQIADQMSVTFGDKVNAWRYLAMLGNPKTHIRNVVSNVAMLGTRAVKNAVARTIEDIALRNKKPTLNTEAPKAEKATAPIRQVMPEGTRVKAADRDNIGTIQSFNPNTGKYTVHFENKRGQTATVSLDASILKPLNPIKKRNGGKNADGNANGGDADIAPVNIRTKTWARASDAVKAFAKTTTAEMETVIKGDNKYSDEGSLKSMRNIFKVKVLDAANNANTDAMEWEDAIFSKNAFRTTLQEYLTANGIKTEEDIKNNPELVTKAKEYALEESRRATFRQDSYLANKISEIEQKSPIYGVAIGSTMPFKKTPINIAKTGLAYSPLGFARNVYDAVKVAKGEMDASEAIDHLAQTLTGTSLTLIGYFLASAGMLNGAGDDDKEGKYDYQLGKQSYSFNFGGDSYSLSWLSPVAMPLFVGANAYETLVEKNEWDWNVVADTLAQTLDPLSEMSFLSSLDDVLSSYDSGIEKFMGAGESMVQNYATQFIPTLSSQIASTFDDTKRSTKASGDSGFSFGEETYKKIAYKIPGLRNTLAPTTDIWGNEAKQNENVLVRGFESFLSPANKREGISTAVDDELKSLYGEVGNAEILPSIPSDYINYDGAKYDMSTKDFTEYKQTYGQTAYDLMESLFGTDTYKNASAEERADMVGRVYDYARDLAKKEYFEKFGVDFANATEDGEEVYKENPIRGAIEADLPVDEYVFSEEYPEKYDFFKSNGISYNTYKAADEDGKRAYSWAYENQGKYTLSKAISDDFLEYYDLRRTMNDFDAKDASGESVSGLKKERVVNYINGLDLDYGQKIILFRSMYDSKEDRANYNRDIVEYLNSREDISYRDMETILKELGFTVDSKGNISWD